MLKFSVLTAEIFFFFVFLPEILLNKNVVDKFKDYQLRNKN